MIQKIIIRWKIRWSNLVEIKSEDVISGKRLVQNNNIGLNLTQLVNLYLTFFIYKNKLKCSENQKIYFSKIFEKTW